jgi:hypothetical protein
VVRFLRGRFPKDSPAVEQITTHSLAPGGSGGSLPDFNTSKGTITLLLYRVDIDMTQRGGGALARQPGMGGQRARQGLALDLRYLVTAWAQQPEVQHLILGKALSALDGHASFGHADLVSTIGDVADIWGPDESFQFVPDDMATEDLYQIWDSLGRTFELSVPYKARVVRLEPDGDEGQGVVLEREIVHGSSAMRGAGRR